MGFERHKEATPSPPFQERRLQVLNNLHSMDTFRVRAEFPCSIHFPVEY